MNPTIARITARGLLGRRRSLLLLPLPVLVVGLALVAHGIAADHVTDWAPPIVEGLGFGALLPIVALIVGTGVLGSEIDDGTIVHILAKPLPRREIILTKLVVAAGITAAVSAVPMFIAGTIISSVAFGVGLGVASVAGALGYSALFILLSLVTRRPMLIGLGYVLLWEGLLGSVLKGTSALSVRQYTQSIAYAVGGGDLLHHPVSLPVAIIMTGVVVVGATALATDRLRSFSVAGETS
jgi:ABC-2 type transport system permease protein